MTEDDFLRCLDGKPLDGPTFLLSPHNQEKAAAPKLASARLRKVPLADRPKPRVSQRRESLRREPVATTQTCFTVGCDNAAAFRTRTRPTWCTTHIAEVQRRGGLKPLEPYTHPDDWQLTECLACMVRAHYRFESG